MGAEILGPDWNKDHKYAVAVFIEGGNVVPLKSYRTIDELKKGYIELFNHAEQRDLSRPVPIEFLDKTGKCRVLEEMLNASKEKTGEN